jgi:hypothetical protein
MACWHAVPGRIVSCGQLERYKGHHRVIEALPYVMHEIAEAHPLILEAVHMRVISTTRSPSWSFRPGEHQAHSAG